MKELLCEQGDPVLTRNLGRSQNYLNMSVLEVSSNREVFTQRGLHLNRLGKRLISKQIATEISRLMEKK